MHAIGVSQYGPPDNLQSREIPRPSTPTGRQMRIETKAVSVNPIDIKVRGGTYDDPPDYYERVRGLTKGEEPNFHVMGYDGAGVVREVGPDVRHFKVGDEVYYLGNPVLQGSYAEEQLVDERHMGHKPRSLDFVQAAAMPLTYATAYEGLVDRLGIQPGREGRHYHHQRRRRHGRHRVADRTARPEAARRHHDGVAARDRVLLARRRRCHPCRQPSRRHRAADPRAGPARRHALKYAFITSRTEQYLRPIADLLAPFGRMCSIVQARFDMYGTQCMSKSLTFSWCWLATGAYHGYVNDQEEKHREWYEKLASLLDDGTIKCHLTQRKRLTLENIREAHKQTEAGKGIGKTALGVDEPGDHPVFQ
ncbi:quinone oxidoreductase [Apiospora kogelbergensis]|uniref:quinone oxidoreductase n=1 Tax=Apiospora kogelbergensis TaxID=1337665 RepID=UPI0031300CCB